MRIYENDIKTINIEYSLCFFKFILRNTMFINLSVQRNLVSFLIIKTFEGAYLLYLNRLFQFRKCIKKS